MAGKGKWILHKKSQRCTGDRKCSACASDPDRKPHGPYYSLRRRSPIDGQQEGVYLGRVSISKTELDLVNRFYTGPDRPTKKEVFTLIAVPPTAPAP